MEERAKDFQLTLRLKVQPYLEHLQDFTLMSLALILGGALFLAGWGWRPMNQLVWEHLSQRGEKWNLVHSTDAVARVTSGQKSNLKFQLPGHSAWQDGKSKEINLSLGTRLMVSAVKSKTLPEAIGAETQGSSLEFSSPFQMIRLLPGSTVSLAAADRKLPLPCPHPIVWESGAINLLMNDTFGAFCIYIGSKHLPLSKGLQDPQVLSLQQTDGQGWMRLELIKDQIQVFFPQKSSLKMSAWLGNKLISESIGGQNPWKLDLRNKELKASHNATPQNFLPAQEADFMLQAPRLLSPYSGARFLSTSVDPLFMALRWEKIPSHWSVELEITRWDDPYFQSKPVYSRYGALVPLPNGNYRWRARSKGPKGEVSEWTPERQLSIQEYLYGLHSPLSVKIEPLKKNEQKEIEHEH